MHAIRSIAAVFRQLALGSMLAWMCAVCAQAQAAAFDVSGDHSDREHPPSLSVAQGDLANAELQDIAALPEANWLAFERFKPYPAGKGRPLWLRLKTSSTRPISEAIWLLEMPTVVVDRYEVYQRNAAGAWTVQLAGDRVAHSAWGVDGLKPRFALTAASAGEHTVFIKVVHVLPVRVAPSIVHRDEATQRDAKQQLWVGLLLGVILALVLTCAQMSVAYRDRTYGWYAGYLVFTAFSALTYSGIGQRELWPHSDKFAGDALLLGVMLAFSFTVKFSLAMFGSVQTRLFHWVANLLIVACVGYLAVLLVRTSPDRAIYVFYAITIGVFSCVTYAAYRAWRRGIVYGGFWLLVYIPFLCSMALTLASSSGLIRAAWLPDATPVWMALSEAIGMMLCLNSYSRVRHAQSVQAQVAALHDPLTGFFTHTKFEREAKRAWTLAQAQQRDVALVHVGVAPATADLIGVLDAEALMARSVRLVRSATREFDLVGRIGADQLAFVMADVKPGDAFAGRMQRLVALGLMNDSGDPRDAPVRFRVWVVFRSQWPRDYASAQAALRELRAADGPDKRAVQYVTLAVGANAHAASLHSNHPAGTSFLPTQAFAKRD